MELEGRLEAAGEGERGSAGGLNGAGGEEVFGDVEGEGRGGHFGVVGRVAGEGGKTGWFWLWKGLSPIPQLSVG